MIIGVTHRRSPNHIQELRVGTPQLAILHGRGAERRGLICDDSKEWIGNLRKQLRSQCKVRVGQLIVVDRHVQTQAAVSGIANRNDEVSGQFFLSIQRPLLVVADSLLPRQTADVLPQQSIQPQAASSRLNQCLRKWIRQVELWCYAVDQRRTRRRDDAKTGRRVSPIHRWSMEDTSAAANDGPFVQTIRKPETRVEVPSLSRLDCGASAVDTDESRAARQSSERTNLRIQGRLRSQVQKHVLVLPFAFRQFEVVA